MLQVKMKIATAFECDILEKVRSKLVVRYKKLFVDTSEKSFILRKEELKWNV